MTRIEKKLMFFFLIFIVTAIVIINAHSFYISSGLIYREGESTMRSRLEQVQNLVDSRVQMAQNYFNVLYQSTPIYDIVRENDWNSYGGEYYLNVLQIDREAERLLYNLDVLKAFVLYPKAGGRYSYSAGESTIADLITDDWRNAVEASSGEIKWFGVQNSEVYSGKYLIAGKKYMPSDAGFMSDMGEAFLIFDLSIDDVLRNEENNDTVMFYNTNNDLLYLSDLSMEPLAAELKQIPDGASVKKRIDGRRMFFLSQRSILAGWKFVIVRQISDFWQQSVFLAGIMLFLSGIVIIIGGIIFYSEGKRIFRPITDIMAAMYKIGQNDFDIHITCEDAGELQIICDGINRLAEELSVSMEKILLMEKEKRKEEIRALQYQMNPHFIYNTLSSVKMCAIRNKVPDVAEQIEILVRLMRNILSPNELITIAQEIENVRSFIALQQFRYKRRIDVQYDVDSEILDCAIPCLLLQPIVENAILHGLSEKINLGQEALLKISAKTEGKDILISVYDNGSGMDKEDIYNGTGSGIALLNVAARVRLIFGERYGTEIDSVQGEYTLFKIIISQMPLSGGNADEKNQAFNCR
ncbi:MAG: histidine kinase [Clostridia bacterium]|nr:histidine kinase [Clostridia bacterium]